MKNLSTLIFILFVSNFFAQQNSGYWQQKVDYKMEIDFFAKKNQFKGNQTLI